jgi:hypothetical protein
MQRVRGAYYPSPRPALDGHAGWVDDGSVPYDVPPELMWQCEDCDDRQSLHDELEE